MFLDVTLQERAPEVEVEKVKKLAYDWRYENSINSGKEPLSLENQEFKYEKWRTNTSLTNHLDTIMDANQMNLNYHLSDQMHYDYLFYSVRKKKRFGSKKSERDKQLEREQKEEAEKIALISEYYKYNTVNAKAALKVLTESQLEIIKRRLERGGVR
jgi:UDP-N-acetylmuramyl tripeptide synthase